MLMSRGRFGGVFLCLCKTRMPWWNLPFFVGFYTEMGNIRKKLTDSQPKPYFYFCHLCRTNIAKSSLIHWSNIFFQSNLRQMKVVLFPCRSWQSVTQLLSSTNGWAKSGCSLFLSCSFLFPFLVLYSKCAIIPINSQQQTCFLACKTSKFQHATIPYCNRNKYTFFFFWPNKEQMYIHTWARASRQED